MKSTKRRGKVCLSATLPTGVAHVYAKLAEYKNRLAWKGTDLKFPAWDSLMSSSNHKPDNLPKSNNPKFSLVHPKCFPDAPNP